MSSSSYRRNLKRMIFEYFDRHPDKRISDFVSERRMDAKVIREVCLEMVAEGSMDREKVEKDKKLNEDANASET